MDRQDIDLLNDSFLNEVFSKIPQESTSGNFTMQVMNQIYARVEPEIEPAVYRKQMLWAYISLTAGILIIGLLIFAIWPFIDIPFKLDSSFILAIVNYTIELAEGISRLGEIIKASSVQIAVFFSVLFLLLVERLIRKDVTKTSSFMF